MVLFMQIKTSLLEIGYLFQYMEYRFVYKIFKLRYAIFSH